MIRNRKFWEPFRVLYIKELGHYFNSSIAYVYLSIFFLFTHWYVFRSFFLLGQASLRLLFEVLPWIFLCLVPAISMRLWAEERKEGTLEFLFTFPITNTLVIAAKFLAAATLLGVALVGTLPMAFTVIFLGSPDIGPMVTGYLAAWLMGLSLLAMGSWLSSLTKSQVVAQVSTMGLGFFALILSNAAVLNSLPQWATGLCHSLSLAAHYEGMARGVIDIRDVGYYLSVIGFFLFLNWMVLNRNRLDP